MSAAPITPRTFYTRHIPAQFNRALADQERSGEAGERLLGEMRAVHATIRVGVEGEGGGTFFLNIEAGRMQAAEAPAHPPFLTVLQDRATFDVLARDAGDSALALLGGLAGLAGELVLTRSRIEALAGVKGSLRFEVSGPEGFSLLTHFGPGPVPDPPTASIRLERETYGALRAGRLEPQAAFMSGQLEVQGDLRLAMELALALMPD